MFELLGSSVGFHGEIRNIYRIFLLPGAMAACYGGNPSNCNDGTVTNRSFSSVFAYTLIVLFLLLLRNGFQMLENRDLLKEGLGVLVGRIKSTGATQFSFMESLK